MPDPTWKPIWPEQGGRTFENPHDITTYDSVTGPRYQIQPDSDGLKFTYNASDFDIVVTLTPKPRPDGV